MGEGAMQRGERRSAFGGFVLLGVMLFSQVGFACSTLHSSSHLYVMNVNGAPVSSTDPDSSHKCPNKTYTSEKTVSTSTSMTVAVRYLNGSTVTTTDVYCTLSYKYKLKQEVLGCKCSVQNLPSNVSLSSCTASNSDLGLTNDEITDLVGQAVTLKSFVINYGNQSDAGSNGGRTTAGYVYAFCADTMSCESEDGTDTTCACNVVNSGSVTAD